jgi:hypothetical protein
VKLNEVIHPLLEGKKVIDPDGSMIICEGRYLPITFASGEEYSFYPDDVLSDKWTVVDE